MFNTLFQFFHHPLTARKKWTALMQFCRVDIEDPPASVDRFTSCYFNYKGKRIALIEQAQFPFWFISRLRVHKYPSL